MAPGPPAPVPPGVALRDHRDYLEACLEAASSMEQVRTQLEELLRICTERRPSRLLVDMTATTLGGTTLERYKNGMIGARLAPYVGRVAVLARAEAIDPEKIGVVVARNRGLTVDVFDDRLAALAWLLA